MQVRAVRVRPHADSNRPSGVFRKCLKIPGEIDAGIPVRRNEDVVVVAVAGEGNTAECRLGRRAGVLQDAEVLPASVDLKYFSVEEQSGPDWLAFPSATNTYQISRLWRTSRDPAGVIGDTADNDGLFPSACFRPLPVLDIASALMGHPLFVLREVVASHQNQSP